MDRSICVTIILTKNKIISTNAGDSSVIMGRYINGKWIYLMLKSRIILAKKKKNLIQLVLRPSFKRPMINDIIPEINNILSVDLRNIRK